MVFALNRNHRQERIGPLGIVGGAVNNALQEGAANVRRICPTLVGVLKPFQCG
jgi:hypothetical protein